MQKGDSTLSSNSQSKLQQKQRNPIKIGKLFDYNTAPIKEGLKKAKETETAMED